MIIDAHYHSLRLPAADEAARAMVAEWVLEAGRAGVKKSVDEALPVYRDYMDDIEGDKLLKRMDESGIDVTAINIVDNVDFGLDNERIMRINERCSKLASRHPGRFIALAGIDPRRPEAPALFRRCIDEFNMRGLKWHPDYGFYPNSREAYAVLEVANELGVPLLTHCSPMPATRAKYAHPIHLDDIALDFPNINIIAAHMGNMWWRDWAALAQYKSNIYGDLSMWQLLAEHKPGLFRRYLREILDIVGPGQVLFGSDGPIYEPHVPNARWVATVKALSADSPEDIGFISREEMEAILGGNASRVFKLEE